MIYAIFAILCVLSILGALAPILKPARLKTEPDGGDTHNPAITFYADQLATLDLDVERGVMSAQEAKVMRHEIGKRILASKGPDTSRPDASDVKKRPVFALGGAVCAILGLSFATYLYLGSPDQPGLPFAQRLENPSAEDEIYVLLDRVESHLAQNPNDGDGWEVLAPVYQMLNRFGDAAQAWQNAARLLGATPDRLLAFAEADIRGNEGIISESARNALLQVKGQDHFDPRVGLFLGIDAAQNGFDEQAINLFEELAAQSPKQAPWLPLVNAQLAQLGQAPVEGGVDSPLAGPSSEDVAAASDMSAQDRAQMINSMVDGLEQRLFEEGGSIQEWFRLVKALGVLGDKARAQAAVVQAEIAFKDDEASLAVLQRLAKEQGLQITGQGNGS